ncbi:hypothetical protein [Haloarchaeobius sp. DFWS5]|uniref:hypothetical protein n=1 Tax=Haloarchaeobius sp. DFWS5 TaxID=3446114 RepID=UPI003EBB82F2
MSEKRNVVLALCLQFTFLAVYSTPSLHPLVSRALFPFVAPLTHGLPAVWTAVAAAGVLDWLPKPGWVVLTAGLLGVVYYIEALALVRLGEGIAQGLGRRA